MIYVLTIFLGVLIIEVAVLGEFVADAKRSLDEVLDIINELCDDNIVNKDEMPSLELPCIGILWNSLDGDLMDEAMDMINEKATIN